MQIILPECSEDKISADLRYLTEVLASQGYDISGGLLGGTYGYGAYFENDIFMMHPFCWCEQDDCEWCRGCTCPEGAYEYRVEGIKVHEFSQWLEAYDKDLKRETVHHEHLKCDYCKGLVGHAPNFLHKPSGTKVRWYKYIGRGMEVSLLDDWLDIFNDCLNSIVAPDLPASQGVPEKWRP